MATPATPERFRIQIPIPHVEVLRLSDQATLPVYASSGAAAMDLYISEEVTLPAESRVLASTGLAMAIPSNWVGLIRARSGMAVRGIETLAGVIDSDYRAEVRILLHNLTKEEIRIPTKTRVAQMLLLFCPQAAIIPVETLNDTSRGAGGFGSTGTT